MGMADSEHTDHINNELKYVPLSTTAWTTHYTHAYLTPQRRDISES